MKKSKKERLKVIYKHNDYLATIAKLSGEDIKAYCEPKKPYELGNFGGRTYDVQKAIKALELKGLTINQGQKSIDLATVKNGEIVGNGTWGKIDYMCNYCGYHTFRSERKQSTKTNKRDYFNADTQTMSEGIKAGKFTLIKKNKEN